MGEKKMKKKELKEDEQVNNSKEVVEIFYKKAMRIIEYYVLLAFLLITFVPLLNYSWVPLFTKFVYMTGFPLLVLLFVISLVKEPLLNFISRTLVIINPIKEQHQPKK
jgi:hypothetical protein